MHKLAYHALSLLVFTIPWAGTVMVQAAGTISRAVGLPVFAIGVAATLSGRLRFHSAHLIAVMFLAWWAASFFWTYNYELSTKRLGTYMQLVLFMWLIFQFADTEAKVERLLTAYVLGALVATAFTLQTFALGAGAIQYRYAAAGINPNDLAYGLALAIPMAWYLASKSVHRITEWLLRLYPLVALFAIVLTGSRGGVIAAFLALLYVPLAKDSMSAVKKASIALIAVAGMVVVVPLIPTVTLDRIGTLFGEATSGDLNGRTSIWAAGIQVLDQHWLLGVGTGNFKSAVAQSLGADFAPHNVYLSILVDGGVVGLTLFGALLGAVWIVLKQMPGNQRTLWLVLMAVWVMASLVANWEARKETWLLLGLLVAHASATLRAAGNSPTVYQGQSRTWSEP